VARVAKSSVVIYVGNVAVEFNDHRLRNLLERDWARGKRDPLQGAEGVLAIDLADAG
jgi:hypothetical protein